MLVDSLHIAVLSVPSLCPPPGRAGSLLHTSALLKISPTLYQQGKSHTATQIKPTSFYMLLTIPGHCAPFLPLSGGSLRSHSMNNLLDPTDTYNDPSESKSYGDVPPPATPDRRASVDVRPISPLPEKKAESAMEMKPSQTKSCSEVPPPPPPPPPPPLLSQTLRRGSADCHRISSLPERKSESGPDAQVLKKNPEWQIIEMFSSVLYKDLVLLTLTISLLYRCCRPVGHLTTRCFPGNS